MAAVMISVLLPAFYVACQLFHLEFIPLNFLLTIIKENNNIPVLLVDDKDNILEQRNFKLPEPLNPEYPELKGRNLEYLKKKDIGRYRAIIEKLGLRR